VVLTFGSQNLIQIYGFGGRSSGGNEGNNDNHTNHNNDQAVRFFVLE